MPKTDEQIRRAYEVLDYIEAHPDKHDQSYWVNRMDGLVTPELALGDCGTTACVAGWTVLLAGRSIVRYDRIVEDAPVEYFSATEIERDLNSVPNMAVVLLGLDEDEEWEMFWECIDLADVRKAIAEIFGPRPDGAM